MPIQRRARDAVDEPAPSRASSVSPYRALVAPVLYTLVGGLNTIVDVGVFWMLVVWLSLPPAVANVISFSAGALNSFLLNNRFTFNQQTVEAGPASKALRFAIVTILMLILSTASVVLLLPYLPVMVAKIMSTVLTLVVGFVLNRKFVFR